MRASTLVVASVVLLSACRGQTTEDPPVVPIRNMYNQPRYDPQERSAFFEDSRTMRPPVPGTVSREQEVDVTIDTGRLADGSGWVSELPTAVIERMGGMDAMLARGQERYGISCSPCHGLSGAGDGTVAVRATRIGAAVMAPPTLHDDRLRHIPDGQLFATITNGVRNMPAYGHNIRRDDRWAIVAYVRALQLSQSFRETAMNRTEEKP